MDDLTNEFITETMDNLTLLDQQMVRLERNPDDPEIIGLIFRVIHTVKGTCGFLGLSRLEKLAHAAENLLCKFRDKALTPNSSSVTVILESLDGIRNIVDHIVKQGVEPEGNDDGLIQKIQACEAGNAVADTAPAPASSGAGAMEVSPEVSAASAHEPVEMETVAADHPVTPAVTDSKKLIADGLERGHQEAKIGHPLSEAEHAMGGAGPKDKESKGADKGGEVGSSQNSNTSIRVPLLVLDKIMQMMESLVLTRNQLFQISNQNKDQQLTASLQQLSYITSSLQESVMKTRMQPIGNAWAKLPRIVRDLSNELGKKIDLRSVGEETELDRQLLEAIKDPLIHLVRNSCDHGIESPAVRLQRGKKEAGTIVLSAYHESGHIVIEIRDDGQGANLEKIKEKAIAKGLITAHNAQAMSVQETLEILFLPGFSTADVVTNISGRGVGMDVVKTNIEQIGGSVSLQSNSGKGMVARIQVPLTLAIVSVLIVEAAGQRFAVPQTNISELIRIDGKNYQLEKIDDSSFIRLRDQLLPVTPLTECMEINEPSPSEESDKTPEVSEAPIATIPAKADEVVSLQKVKDNRFVVLCKVGAESFGIIVDRILNIEEIVVKPVSRVIKRAPVFSGNTILGDGSVIMIIEPSAVFEMVAHKAKDIAADTTLGKHQDEASEGLDSHEVISFLLFDSSLNEPRAVPLEMVWRIEYIDMNKVERASDALVLQYRDELMQMIIEGDQAANPQALGVVPVIVFLYDRRFFGLVVKKINDIVDIPFTIQFPGKEKNDYGSMVISDRTTSIINVPSLLSGYVRLPDMIGMEKRQGRVLFVDDSMFFRHMTGPFLRDAGYEVVEAASAIEALAMMEQDVKSFDIIVTDINMPGMSGFTFADTCKSFPAWSEVPIIGYTSSLEQAESGKQHGSLDRSVHKNNRIELLEVIAKFLKQPQKMKQKIA